MVPSSRRPPRELHELVLGNAAAVARFQKAGTTPFVMELLQMNKGGGEMASSGVNFRIILNRTLSMYRVSYLLFFSDGDILRIKSLFL